MALSPFDKYVSVNTNDSDCRNVYDEDDDHLTVDLLDGSLDL